MSFDAETQRLLGAFITRLDAIEKSLSDNEKSASDSRRLVYQSLREIREEAQETKRRTASLETLFEKEIKPFVRGVLDWRSRAVGALAVIGFIGAAIIFILTQAKELMLDIWRLMVDR